MQQLSRADIERGNPEEVNRLAKTFPCCGKWATDNKFGAFDKRLRNRAKFAAAARGTANTQLLSSNPDKYGSLIVRRLADASTTDFDRLHLNSN
jgi:hypothetical protein